MLQIPHYFLSEGKIQLLPFLSSVSRRSLQVAYVRARDRLRADLTQRKKTSTLEIDILANLENREKKKLFSK